MTVATDNLAQLLLAAGDTDAAEDAQRRVVSLHRGSDDRIGLADALRNPGVLLALKGDWKGAEDAHREGIEISSSMGSRGERSLAHNAGNLAIVVGRDGRFEEARDHLLKAMETNERLGRGERLVVDRSNLADVLLALGELTEAREQAMKALRRNRARAPHDFTAVYGPFTTPWSARSPTAGAHPSPTVQYL